MTTRPPVPPFHPSRLVLVLTRHAGRRGVVLSCPHLPGWAATARGPVELAYRTEEAWRELAVRAYAEGRQEEYDLAPFEEQSARPITPPGDPWAWRLLETGPDAGKWLSPGGRRYGPATAVVQKVLAARERRPRPEAQSA